MIFYVYHRGILPSMVVRTKDKHGDDHDRLECERFSVCDHCFVLKKNCVLVGRICLHRSRRCNFKMDFNLKFAVGFYVTFGWLNLVVP
jgi:hypothetical protein